MIVAICQFDIVLVAVPSEGFIGEFLDAFFVKFIANDNGYNGAELSFKIDETCETKGQKNFGDHKILVFGVVFVGKLFF